MRIVIEIILLFLLSLFHTQPGYTQFDKKSNEEISRILFYNVENLFHPLNDSLTDDDEFTPDAIRHWSFYRYRQKLIKIYKTIAAAGGWQGFDLVGLCEIENRQVLSDLIKSTPLVKQNYRILHKDSEDSRGIDVALLYREKKFFPVDVKFYRVVSPDDKLFRTRNILYTKGIISTDTLHIFVNHWPSRWGGVINTQVYRNIAAKILREAVDSILNVSPDAKVIIMGDFNDEPDDVSLSRILQAKTEIDSVVDNNLCNLSGLAISDQEMGAYKYKGLWENFDQFIISAKLLNDKNGWYTGKDDVNIFCPEFLLENEKDIPGRKPFRTYSGYRYVEGFSDHLPICLTLHKNTDN